jgi:hypothetical protein
MVVDMNIDLDKAETIAREFIKSNFDKIPMQYKSLNAGKLYPNKTINNPTYWEFWLVQEDAKLANIEFAQSIGIDLTKVLTYAGKVPSVLLAKIRVSKEAGSVELVNVV